MIDAQIVLDTRSPNGDRITTFRLKMPRFILAQFNTHRVFSRNTSSSRAVPTPVLVEQVETQPFMPIGVAKNGSGMLPKENLPEEGQAQFLEQWHELGTIVAEYVQNWHNIGIHKQHANRALEPWLFCEVLVTSTDFENFFKLRCQDAQPEMCELACKMRDAMRDSEPVLRPWHLPLVAQEEIDAYLAGKGILDILKVGDKTFYDSFLDLAMVSAGRCCRVSYLRTDAESDFESSKQRCQMLIDAGHWSPLEHQAFPWNNAHGKFSKVKGNLIGFCQHRTCWEAVATFREGVANQKKEGNKMNCIKLNDVNDVQARLELILRANQDPDGEVPVVVKTSKNYLIDSTATVKDENVSFYIDECNDELVGQVVAWTFEKDPHEAQADNTIEHILDWFKLAKPNPTEKDQATQIGAHFEEVGEMLDAIWAPSESVKQTSQEFYQSLAVNINVDGKDVYLPENWKALLLDSLCDQIVTAVGVAHMMGWDIVGALKEVNASNFSKFEDGKPLFNEHGKIMKGSSYFKPNLTPYLNKE